MGTRKVASRKKKGLAPAPMRAAPRGGRLRSGNPGNKGGTGRPKNEYREFLRKLLRGKNHQAQLKLILENCNHPAFSAVYGKVVVHAEGIPQSADEGGDAASRPHVHLDV